MNFTTRTAIEIMTEEDRKEVIPFFEHHFPNCNIRWRFGEEEVDIGNVWFISKEYYGGLDGSSTEEAFNKFRGDGYYTILKGVPQNWREEAFEQKQLNEIIEVFDKIPKETFQRIIEEFAIPKKLYQLESENKELREYIKTLSDIIDESPCDPDITKSQIEAWDRHHAFVRKIGVERIKQLLEK